MLFVVVEALLLLFVAGALLDEDPKFVGQAKDGAVVLLFVELLLLLFVDPKVVGQEEEPKVVVADEVLLLLFVVDAGQENVFVDDEDEVRSTGTSIEDTN